MVFKKGKRTALYSMQCIDNAMKGDCHVLEQNRFVSKKNYT